MMRRWALMACVGLCVGRLACAEESLNLLKLTDFDGKITYAVKTRAEWRVLQLDLREETPLFKQAMAQARQTWDAEPGHAEQPFPAAQFRMRGAATVGGSFTDRAKAEERAARLQAKEDERDAKSWEGLTAPQALAREEFESGTLELLRRTLKELRQTAQAKAAEALAVAAATSTPAAVPAGAAPGAVRPRVALEFLRPVATEWGTEPHAVLPDIASGVRVCDWGSNGNASPGFWPNESKIITGANKSANPLPQGQAYASTMTNCFVVAGEYVAGVGLWARRMTFYHWLEYNIPANATIFTGDIYVTDDAMGQCWWRLPSQQQFRVTLSIDGQPATALERSRVDLQPGSGQLLETVTVPIPQGAKRIRFRLDNSGWGDGNCNTEIVISNGAFIL